MRGRLTHISIDGLSTPLGRSQVLAVSERLRAAGWTCTVLSLEPEPEDRADFEALERRVASGGIRWLHRPYIHGRLGTVKNVMSVAAMVRRMKGETDIFHCRSYFGAFFPAASSMFGRAPYVFDTRGYWVDEKIESGRWFQDRASRSIARQVERQLYERASGIVCLTELATEDVRSGRFGRRHPEALSICIPTCADYEKFTMEKGDPPHRFLRDGPIVAYVGSLNPSYEYRKSLELAVRVLQRIPRAKFLALTSQISDMTSLTDELSIPQERRLITSVGHEEVHQWLPWIDFGLTLLVAPNQAKRASMPTKLGEFFATGVSPISHGANREVDEWIRRAGSGFVLDDLSAASLDQALEFVAKGPPDSESLSRARRVAEPHFSLESGVARYDSLFQGVLATSA